MNIQDVIDAIRQNGYTKIKHRYFHTDTYGYSNTPDEPAKANKILGGCALGQASINLGISVIDLEHRLMDSNIWSGGHPLNAAIRSLNDMTNLSLPQIADELEKRLSEAERARQI